MTRNTVPSVSGLLLALSLSFWAVGCQTASTPQAITYDTLRAAAVAIDAYRASYEAAYQRGEITLEKKTDADRRFNRANDAIIAAARVARDTGNLDSATPAEVDAAVKALAELVTTLVPPKPRTTL